MLCTDTQAQVKIEYGEAIAEPLYCRCWSCEICKPRRAAELRRLAKSGNPTTFLTLTVNPARGDSPSARARDLRDAWRKLRYALKRRYPAHNFPFIAAFEETRRHEPHLHLLFRGPYVPKQWLSDQMERLIQAPIVDISYVRDIGRVAVYVAKYLAKAPVIWEGCKRYWRSQDFELEHSQPPARTWSERWMVKVGLPAIARDQNTTGITIADVIPRGRITIGWWSNSWRWSET